MYSQYSQQQNQRLMQISHLDIQEHVKAESKSHKKEDKHNCRFQQSFHDHLQHHDKNSTLFKSRDVLKITTFIHFSAETEFHSVSIVMRHQVLSFIDEIIEAIYFQRGTRKFVKSQAFYFQTVKLLCFFCFHFFLTFILNCFTTWPLKIIHSFPVSVLPIAYGLPRQ